MRYFFIKAATITIVALTTPSFAESTFDTAAPVTPAVFGITFAQANGAISESDLRRIHHYSARALAALNALGAAAIPTNQDINMLGDKVRRLTDAGQRSGLSLDQTAVYFAAYVTENNTGALPGFLLGSNGQIDAQKLLRSVENFSTNIQPEGVDIAAINEQDLVAIGSVAIGNVPAPEPANLQLSIVVLSEDTLQTPTIPPNASPEIRSVLTRVKLRGDNWVIEVAPGDSLRKYAEALYGDPNQYQRIYSVNSNVLRSANTITVGQVLVLPNAP